MVYILSAACISLNSLTTSYKLLCFQLATGTVSFNMDNIPYEISSTEKVQNLEKELQSELDELRTELEDNDILQGASSKNIRYMVNRGFAILTLVCHD